MTTMINPVSFSINESDLLSIFDKELAVLETQLLKLRSKKSLGVVRKIICEAEKHQEELLASRKVLGNKNLDANVCQNGSKEICLSNAEVMAIFECLRSAAYARGIVEMVLRA